jgi:hypothetical protein
MDGHPNVGSGFHHEPSIFNIMIDGYDGIWQPGSIDQEPVNIRCCVD